jgi:hypothetical protein
MRSDSEVGSKSGSVGAVGACKTAPDRPGVLEASAGVRGSSSSDGS